MLKKHIKDFIPIVCAYEADVVLPPKKHTISFSYYGDRPTWNASWMMMSFLTSLRSTCPRKRVGAVLVDIDNNPINSGYNGKPSGVENCTEKPCYDSTSCSYDDGRNLCSSIHAEINAISRNTSGAKPYSIYVSTAPCKNCAKAIAAIPTLKNVYYSEEYVSNEGVDWLREMGRYCERIDVGFQISSEETI